MRKIIYIVSLVVVVLSSCTSAKQLNYLQDKDPYYAMAPFEDYVLQRNDEIYCTILTKDVEFADEFNNQLSEVVSSGDANHVGNSYTIYENGYVSIPFFGDIKIVDLTIPEAEEVILRKMQEAIPNAQVKISLRNNLFYVVSSDGNKIGTVYKDNMTIYQALAVSGDVSKNISMDLGKVKIVRMGKDGNSVIKTFDLRSSSVIESDYYYIKPNDVIYYSKSPGSFFRVTNIWAFISTVILPITFISYYFLNIK